MNKIKSVFNIILPEHAIIPLIGIFIGASIAGQTTPNFNLLIIPFISFVFLVWGFNALNGIFDLNVDTLNKPKRPLPNKDLTIKQVFLITLVFDITGLILAFFVSLNIFILALAFVVVGLMYSMSPLHLKARFLGINLTGGIMYGIIPVLIGNLLVSNILISFPFYLFIFGVTALLSSIKDFDDWRGDSTYKIKTLPVLLGPKNAAKIIGILLLTIVITFLIYSIYTFDQRMILASSICLLFSLILVIYLLQNMEDIQKFYSRDIIHESSITRMCILIILFMETVFGLVYLI